MAFLKAATYIGALLQVIVVVASVALIAAIVLPILGVIGYGLFILGGLVWVLLHLVWAALCLVWYLLVHLYETLVGPSPEEDPQTTRTPQITPRQRNRIAVSRAGNARRIIHSGELGESKIPHREKGPGGAYPGPHDVVTASKEVSLGFYPSDSPIRVSTLPRSRGFQVGEPICTARSPRYDARASTAS